LKSIFRRKHTLTKLKINRILNSITLIVLLLARTFKGKIKYNRILNINYHRTFKLNFGLVSGTRHSITVKRGTHVYAPIGEQCNVNPV